MEPEGQGDQNAKNVLEHAQTAVYRDYGTPANVRLIQVMGALPTRNFSAGSFENGKNIYGTVMREGDDVEIVEPNLVPELIKPVNTYAVEDGAKGDRSIGITPGVVHVGARRVDGGAV